MWLYVFAVICATGVVWDAYDGRPSLSAAEPALGKARLTIVFILDGLHPDSINPNDTPNLNDDRHIGLIVEKLTALGLAEFTNIFVVSDHGFGVHTFAINVSQALIGAGLKAAPDSDDVVLASSGQAVLLHVKNHDAQRIQAIVEFLQAHEWTGVLFTEPRQDDWERDPRGWVPGTFSLKLIHVSNAERGPDILLTLPWTSEKNAFGVEGTDFTNTSGTTGPVTTDSSGHGSMSPWTVRNTFFAWGVDFKDHSTVRVPASNVDLTPTILALLGVADPEVREGRVLVEARTVARTRKPFRSAHASL